MLCRRASNALHTCTSNALHICAYNAMHPCASNVMHAATLMRAVPVVVVVVVVVVIGVLVVVVSKYSMNHTTATHVSLKRFWLNHLC